MDLDTRSRAARRARRIAVAVALATTIAGCGAGADEPNATPSLTQTPAAKDAAQAIKDAASIYTRAAPAKGAPVQETVDGINAFATALYKVAAKPGDNTVFSPLSIAYAFAMVRVGARGETAAQLDQAFGFPAGRDSGFNALTNGLVSAATDRTPEPVPESPADADVQARKPTFTLANALFVQQNYALVGTFLRALTEQYGSEIEAFPNPDAAVGQVNEWASLHTAGRIPKVFDQLDPMTRLVIANAVYLKADWTMPFTKRDDGVFTVAGTPMPVPMMERKDATLGYAKGPGWETVELPYFGDDLVMRVLLPTGSTTPADLLTPTVLAAAAKTTPTELDVTMPKWDFGTDLDLKALLLKLGVTAPFDQRADFSGISTEALVIDQAVHKANITVDELGTVASAVSAVAMTGLSFHQPPQQFTVDRPFAFEIVDLKTGAPLFLGSVADPRAK